VSSLRKGWSKHLLCRCDAIEPHSMSSAQLRFHYEGNCGVFGLLKKEAHPRLTCPELEGFAIKFWFMTCSMSTYRYCWNNASEPGSLICRSQCTKSLAVYMRTQIMQSCKPSFVVHCGRCLTTPASPSSQVQCPGEHFSLTSRNGSRVLQSAVRHPKIRGID
jgi:hypothetical protein